ncbi:MAG TPA: M3 family metallopeptidase, partial [Acidimicrobiia bacterium]|nr:M3 family metallopeptidase [Acidimicrobiia bacterium]
MSFNFAETPEEVDTITEEAIERADTLVEQLVSSSPGTTADTLLPLDEIGAALADSFGRGGFMAFVHPDPAVREAGRRAEERLQKWAVDLVFRDDLYRAVKEFADSDEAKALSGEPARLLEFTLRDLRKAGHELEPEARDEAKRIAARLVELSVAFDRNVAEWQDHLTVSTEDLDGLPDDYIARLQLGEVEGTYKVTMAYPDVVPFLENARRRDLRRELAYKFNTRAVEANTPLLKEAVELRRRTAELFGLPSWAHYVMDEKMAKEPGRVSDFYDRLTPPLTDKGRLELDVMAKLLEQDTGESIVQPWDWRYYDTQIRRRDFGVDPHEVAAYFPLDQVLDGMLEITGEVFGVEYRVLDDQPVWHSDVTAWAIVDGASGEDIATVFMDLFPREGTYSHAAAFPLVAGRREDDGGYRHPISAIVANLTKPTPERP